MNMKKICSILLALAMILTLSLTAFGASGGGLRVFVDGKLLDSAGAYITGDGTAMIPLRAVAEALGCDVIWDGETQTVSVVSNPSHPDGTPAPQHRPLVVLDPGHGGSANGAAYGGVQEKDLNLSIALQAAELLRQAGLNVVMTRTDDRYVDLYERTDLANGLGADLFVSVHCNASVDHDDALGIYTCSYAEGTEGWRLAEALYQTVRDAAGAPAFGMEPRPNLAVLRTSSMPAALVECGFMSTEEELALLVQPEYQAKLAQGIAGGVLAYLAQE